VLSDRHSFLRTFRHLIPCAILLALSLSLAAPARAQIATYPQLPRGYSSIRVFDNQQRFVGRIMPTQRYWVGIDRIPVFLRNALIATEDARFYQHQGIDVRGIARALVKDVVKGRLAEGGSTITQQLIKNKFLTGEKSIDRKVKEVQLAMDFEKKYTKDQILEMYFNEIYFGNGAWGIAQAARLYFDKNPEELTDAECSLLAGVPKNPGRYNPLGDTAKVSARRSTVLKRMLDVNMITAAQKRAIEAHPATVIKAGQAPGYLDLVRRQLVERYGSKVVEQGGLDVVAALDLDLQKQAEQVLREGVKKVNPNLQGALLSLDLKTGDVLAAVGGTDGKGGFNRAFSAKRQPGSAIKPLIFADALENGFTAGTILDDHPVAYNRGNGQVWKPQNYERKSYGELSLRQALAHSNNVITVKLLDAIGVNNFVGFAGSLGLTLRSPNDLSLGLGTDEVTLKDLVSAYTPFANGGVRSEARTIIRIFDRSRRAWTENPPVVEPVLPPVTAFVTTEMMKDVLDYGTAKGLKKFARQRPSAGKTGTTDDYRDAWFVGYTPQIITGVWVGYDKPKPVGRGFTGGAVSAPIWERFMRVATAGKPAVDFPKPDGVVTATIDPTTGELATPICPTTREEFYIVGTEPTQYCSKHGGDTLEHAAPEPQPQPEQPEQVTPPEQPEPAATEPETPAEEPAAQPLESGEAAPQE
jgi:1A family penicillin-binding protein